MALRPTQGSLENFYVALNYIALKFIALNFGQPTRDDVNLRGLLAALAYCLL